MDLKYCAATAAAAILLDLATNSGKPQNNERKISQQEIWLSSNRFRANFKSEFTSQQACTDNHRADKCNVVYAMGYREPSRADTQTKVYIFKYGCRRINFA